jgi:iduronate 2-sulfatase
MRFLFMRSTCAAALLFALLLVPQEGFAQQREQQQEQRPNVLLIVVDDLNDYLSTPGFRGHPQARTPHIDRLAASGVSFTRAYSNNPICAPSRASMFTGIYPHESGNFDWDKWYEQDVLKNSKTMMTYFDDHGYHVAGTGKIMHHPLEAIWDDWGVDVYKYGPLAFDGQNVTGHSSVPPPVRYNAFFGGIAPLSDVPYADKATPDSVYTGYVNSFAGAEEPFHYESPTDRDLTPDERYARWAEEKLRALERRDAKRPFFMGVGFVRPHTPLYAPKKYFEQFPLEDIELPVIMPEDRRDTYFETAFSRDASGLKNFRETKAAYDSVAHGLKHRLQGYLACTAFVDDQIGRVLQALNESKFRDNTVVVLTSDHGYHLGEKDYLFKDSPWEESTRVPLIIRAPGVSEAGTQVGHPVSLIDVYPTLKDLAGLDGPTMKNENGKPLDGHSLTPFLRDPDDPSWSGPDGALSVLYGGTTQEDIYEQTYTYRTRDWRYVRYHNGAEELYNHVGDPYEWHNEAADKRFYEVKERLREEMMRLIEGEVKR